MNAVALSLFNISKTSKFTTRADKELKDSKEVTALDSPDDHRPSLVCLSSQKEDLPVLSQKVLCQVDRQQPHLQVCHWMICQNEEWQLNYWAYEHFDTPKFTRVVQIEKEVWTKNKLHIFLRNHWNKREEAIYTISSHGSPTPSLSCPFIIILCEWIFLTKEMLL